jgi:hypothetical protein
MKVIFQRRHVVRPENYESVELIARFEIDSDNEQDAEYFEGNLRTTGNMLSEDADMLLDADVDRTLRLDGQHIDDTHLWAFYEKD